MWVDPVPFVIGLLICRAGIRTLNGARRDNNGIPLVGTVIDHEMKQQRINQSLLFPKMRWFYYPIVEYTSPITGKRERMTSRIGYRKAFELGRSAKMTYDQELGEVRFPLRLRSVGWVVLLIGLAAVALSRGFALRH